MLAVKHLSVSWVVLLASLMTSLITVKAHASLVDSDSTGSQALPQVAESASAAGTTFGPPDPGIAANNYLAAAFDPPASPRGFHTAISTIQRDTGARRSVLQGGNEEIKTQRQAVTAVPEPSVVGLLLTGLLALVLSRRRRRPG